MNKNFPINFILYVANARVNAVVHDWTSLILILSDIHFHYINEIHEPNIYIHVLMIEQLHQHQANNSSLSSI